MTTAGSGRLIVLGWDGATFDIIRPLAASGRMPHTAALLERGAFAALHSTIPAVTPVAWTTMTTGVNPGKHGIFDGHQLDPATGRIRFASAAMRRTPPLWSMINACGGRTAVLNVPVTYPPEKVNGFLAPGMFAPPGAPDAIHPAELGAVFTARFGPLADSPPKYADPQRYLASLLEGVRTRRDMVLWLLEQGAWEMLFAVFMESDRVQHFFWRYRDPASPQHAALGQAIERVYEALDEALGDILAAAGPDVNVALVSDHGAGPLHTGVFLNGWLMERGLLHLTQDFTRAFSRPSGGLARRALAKALSLVAPGLASSLKADAMNTAQDTANNLLRSLIDWERTTAWSDGMGGGIYLNAASPQQRDTLCDDIAAALTALTDPRTGARPIQAVQRREALYHGPAVNEAPDLIVTCAPGYQIFAPHEFLINGQTPGGELFLEHPWSGRHEPYGVFALAGPGVGGGDVGACEMADVTPTLLALLGLAPPPDLDGDVLSRALTFPVAGGGAEGSAASAGAAPTEISPEAEEAMKAHLKSLGYL